MFTLLNVTEEPFVVNTFKESFPEPLDDDWFGIGEGVEEGPDGGGVRLRVDRLVCVAITIFRSPIS